jgi:hypothetical protein
MAEDGLGAFRTERAGNIKGNSNVRNKPNQKMFPVKIGCGGCTRYSAGEWRAGGFPAFISSFLGCCCEASMNRGGNTKCHALVPRIYPGGESFFIAKGMINFGQRRHRTY